MEKTYTVTAGNNSTDLGRIGWSATILGAKRLGRGAVRAMLPGGEGAYTVYDANKQVLREERSLRTGNKWCVVG